MLTHKATGQQSLASTPEASGWGGVSRTEEVLPSDRFLATRETEVTRREPSHGLSSHLAHRLVASSVPEVSVGLGRADVACLVASCSAGTRVSPKSVEWGALCAGRMMGTGAGRAGPALGTGGRRSTEERPGAGRSDPAEHEVCAERPRTPYCPARRLCPEVGARGASCKPACRDVDRRSCLGARRAGGGPGSRWGVADPSRDSVCGIFQFHQGGLRPSLTATAGD